MLRHPPSTATLAPMPAHPSPRLRIVRKSERAADFGELVADVASFAVVRVPSLRWLDERSWTLSCREPFLTLRTTRERTVVTCESHRFLHVGDPLDLIDRLLERLRPRHTLGLPFEGGLVGFLGYELLDEVGVSRSDGPDAWLAFPRSVQITPDVGSEVEVFVEDLPAPAELARELGCGPVEDPALTPSGRSVDERDDPPVRDPNHGTTRADVRARFVTAVEECQRLIAAGDLYQANLSHQLEMQARCDARELAIATWTRHPAPHQIFVDCGEFQVVGASPELFLRNRAGRIAVRPIKGTRRRGVSPIEDHRLRDELAADPKEAAEHVMIVDLERSDLGRMARTGSVSVPELMSIESFGTVHHLVSTVMAECRFDTTVGGILRATFPCGSVTGAPKIRAREVIRSLESGPRGLYTGATGFIDSRGDLELAVAIRTAVVTPTHLRYGVGAGIVSDSIPQNEWDETMLKSEAFSIALKEVVGASPRPPRSSMSVHQETLA